MASNKPKPGITLAVDASGQFPELTRRDQVRGRLTGIGGVKRLNGPPAALLVGRTRHGRPIALEVNLAALVVCVEALGRAHGIDVQAHAAQPAKDLAEQEAQEEST